jgi:hypothetical protein
VRKDGEETVRDPAAPFVHVDDFIDDVLRCDDRGERYARFFFMLHRLPASEWAQFGEWLAAYELYATHIVTGKRWRLVGASTMGDVYVKELAGAPPASRDWQPYYDHRGFSVTDFKDWSDKP